MTHCGHAGDDFAGCHTRAEHDAECLKPFSKVSIIFNSTTSELRPSQPPNGQPPKRYPSISSVCNGPGASYEPWENRFLLPLHSKQAMNQCPSAQSGIDVDVRSFRPAKSETMECF